MFQMPHDITREHHQSLTSTQDRAKEIAKQLTSPEWRLVTADSQNKARGTHGRVWYAPANVNLYATFVFPLSHDKASLIINIPQVIAYSILQVLRDYGLRPQLKWVNDILVNGKKVSGVLCEAENSIHLNNHYMILAGVGINVNMDKESCGAIDQPATSLMLELGRMVDKEHLLNKLAFVIKENIGKLLQQGFSPFVADISSNLAFKGEKISVHMDDKDNTIKEGICDGINDQGMLLLKQDSRVETLFLGRILWHSNKGGQSMKTVAIIGAGPSGLVAAKYAKDAGLEPVIFEQRSDIGGVWHPESGLVWDTMQTNLSYFSCMFSDLPWEGPIEDFPNQAKMAQYLSKYAEKFNIRRHILFNREVLNLQENGQQWEIASVAKNQSEKREIRTFDYVIIASGIFSEANIPNFTGLDTFKGLKLHSKDYKNSTQFKGKRVAIVGSGFSGIEIASDLAKDAKEVRHLFRKSNWILPRHIPLKPADENSPKWPLDLLFYNRSTRAVPEEIKFKTPADNLKSNQYMSTVCSAQGMASPDLNKPSDTWEQPSFVTISDNYVAEVRNGRVIPKKADISAFQKDGIVVSSGEKYFMDAVIFCTGYKLKMPFLSRDIANKVEFDSTDQLQPLILYKCTFRPELKNIAFVGVYRGPYFGVMELQAKWAIAVFTGKAKLPEESIVNKSLEDERKIRTLSPRPQFPHGDYVGLADSIAKEINCLPDFQDLKTSNPSLYELIYRQPVVPVDYRFVEEGKLVNSDQLAKLTAQLNEVKSFLQKCGASASKKEKDDKKAPSREELNKNDSLLWGFSYKQVVGIGLVAAAVGVSLYFSKIKKQ